MNNEMIRYLLFLLNSEDLKKQSNRIIAEVGHNGNTELLEEILNVIQQLLELNKTSFSTFEKSISDKLKNISTSSELKIELTPIVSSIKPQNEMLLKLSDGSQVNAKDLQTIIRKQDEILTKMLNLEERVKSVENLEKIDIIIDLLGGVKGKASVAQLIKGKKEL